MKKSSKWACSLSLACAAAVLWAGCYSTKTVTADGLLPIVRPANTGELVLEDKKGSPVRLGPNSKIRFIFYDATMTRWIEGRQLMVGPGGVWEKLSGGKEKKWVASWHRIAGAKIKNLNGPKTYGVILGSAAIAGVVVVIVAGGGKGGGSGLGGLGKGLGKAGKALARGASRAGKGLARGAAHAGRGLARGAAHAGRGLARGAARIYGPPHLHVDVHVGARAEVGPPHPADPPPGRPPGQAEPPPPPPPETATGPSPLPPPVGAERDDAPIIRKPSHSFAGPVRRRSAIRFLTTLETGTDLVTHDGMTTTALVGMRLYDVLEISAGAKLLLHRGVELEPDGRKQELRTSWIALGRVVAHLDMDTKRRVALPIGFEIGAGHAQIDVRAVLGVRFRLTGYLHLGLYPFNPAYTRFEDEKLERKLGWWSFPTTMDLSFSF